MGWRVRERTPHPATRTKRQPGLSRRTRLGRPRRVFRHLLVVSGFGGHQNKNIRRLPPAQRGGTAPGKTQRLAAAAARSGRAGGRQNAARGRARPGRARWRCPQPGLRSNGRGRGRARHGPGCASSASLRAPVRAALAKGVPVLPAPTPPPPAADPVSRPAASAVAEPPAEVPPPSDTRARHRSRPVPTSRPPPQPPRSLFSSASEPAADGDARGRHVTARRSRGRGRAGGSHAPAASARGARNPLSPLCSPTSLALSCDGPALLPHLSPALYLSDLTATWL